MLQIPGYDLVAGRYVPADTPCTCVHEGFETKGCPRHWPRRPDSTD
jgi:hypothetical protein